MAETLATTKTQILKVNSRWILSIFEGLVMVTKFTNYWYVACKESLFLGLYGVNEINQQKENL